MINYHADDIVYVVITIHEDSDSLMVSLYSENKLAEAFDAFGEEKTCPDYQPLEECVEQLPYVRRVIKMTMMDAFAIRNILNEGLPKEKE